MTVYFYLFKWILFGSTVYLMKEAFHTVSLNPLSAGLTSALPQLKHQLNYRNTKKLAVKNLGTSIYFYILLVPNIHIPISTPLFFPDFSSVHQPFPPGRGHVFPFAPGPPAPSAGPPWSPGDPPPPHNPRPAAGRAAGSPGAPIGGSHWAP